MESGGRRPMGDPVSSQVGGRLQRHQSGCTYTTGDATHIAIAQRVALPRLLRGHPLGGYQRFWCGCPLFTSFFVYMQNNQYICKFS